MHETVLMFPTTFNFRASIIFIRSQFVSIVYSRKMNASIEHSLLSVQGTRTRSIRHRSGYSNKNCIYRMQNRVCEPTNKRFCAFINCGLDYVFIAVQNCIFCVNGVVLFYALVIHRQDEYGNALAHKKEEFLQPVYLCECS